MLKFNLASVRRSWACEHWVLRFFDGTTIYTCAWAYDRGN